MNETMYRYEMSLATLEYLLKILGARPHDEVRQVYDQLLRGRIEQDQEREREGGAIEGSRTPLLNGQSAQGVAQ